METATSAQTSASQAPSADVDPSDASFSAAKTGEAASVDSAVPELPERDVSATSPPRSAELRNVNHKEIGVANTFPAPSAVPKTTPEEKRDDNLVISSSDAPAAAVHTPDDAQVSTVSQEIKSPWLAVASSVPSLNHLVVSQKQRENDLGADALESKGSSAEAANGKLDMISESTQNVAEGTSGTSDANGAKDVERHDENLSKAVEAPNSAPQQPEVVLQDMKMTDPACRTESASVPTVFSNEGALSPQISSSGEEGENERKAANLIDGKEECAKSEVPVEKEVPIGTTHSAVSDAQDPPPSLQQTSQEHVHSPVILETISSSPENDTSASSLSPEKPNELHVDVETPSDSDSGHGTGAENSPMEDVAMNGIEGRNLKRQREGEHIEAASSETSEQPPITKQPRLQVEDSSFDALERSPSPPQQNARESAENPTEDGSNTRDTSAESPPKNTETVSDGTNVSPVMSAEPLTLSLRSAPISQSLDEQASGEGEGSQISEPKPEPKKKPRKRVHWAADEDLVEVHPIDTRIALIMNWDPESEITLPFVPSTLAHLRSQAAYLKSQGEGEGLAGVTQAPKVGLGIRSAPQVNEFELAKRKEHEMELERARQAKQELQNKLDEMKPTKTWSSPSFLILPSECRAVSSDGDSTETEGGASIGYDSESTLESVLPWLYAEDVVQSSIDAPSSPISDADLEDDGDVARIPLSDNPEECDASGSISSAPPHRSTEVHISHSSGPNVRNNVSVGVEKRAGHQASIPTSQRLDESNLSHASGRGQSGSQSHMMDSQQRTHSPPKSGASLAQGFHAGVGRHGSMSSAGSALRSSSGPAMHSGGVAPGPGLPIPAVALQQLLSQFQANNGRGMPMPPPFPPPPGMMHGLPLGMQMPPGMAMPPSLPQVMNLQQQQQQQQMQMRLQQQQHMEQQQQMQAHESQRQNSRGRKSNQLCRYFNTQQGCRDGPNCSFLHVQERGTGNSMKPTPW